MLQRKSFIGCLLSAFLMTASCATTAPKGASVERTPASVGRWDQVVEQFTEEYFRLYPDVAARAGRHEFDGLLPDWSPAGLKRTSQTLRRLRKTVEEISETGLSEEQKFQRQYLLGAIDSELYWVDESDTAYIGIDYYRRAFEISTFVYDEYAAPQVRMRALTRFTRSLALASDEIRGNIRLPMNEELRAHSASVVRGLAKFLDGDVREVFKAVRDADFDLAIGEAAAKLKELGAFFDGQKGRATAGFAMGPERFQKMLKANDGVTLPLAQVKRAGENDLARNQRALAQVCAKYAPGVSISECIAKAEREKPADMLVAARGQLKELKAFLVARGLVTIPSDEDVLVKESPSYLRWNTAYLRAPGPLDQGLPSTFFISPPNADWPAEKQRAYVKAMPALLLTGAHEVWPGHFLHALHDNRRPLLFGRIFRAYSTVEGWAHYTEEMMVDEGLGGGDPRVRIAQLKYALMRDARFLSSIGLHTENWTRDKARKFFQDNAYSDAGLAEQQSLRGIFDPGFSSYTLGKLMVKKLRADWLKLHNGTRTQREFHDQFLSYGNPPIPLIRRQMLGPESSPPLF